jgi:AcrR family transcriptional regulator
MPGPIVRWIGAGVYHARTRAGLGAVRFTASEDVRMMPDVLTPVIRKSRTGRPRPPATEQSILRATIELLTEGGLAGATVDAIAQRSGCAKTTIYRRWPSRDALILDAFRVAVQATAEEIAEAREYDRVVGSTLHGSARNVLRLLRNPLFRAAFPTIAHEVLGETPLGDRFRAEVFRPIRAFLRERLLEDVKRGELRPGADPDLIFDLVNGAMLYRALVGEPIDEGVADAMADLILTGTGGAVPPRGMPATGSSIARGRRG